MSLPIVDHSTLTMSRMSRLHNLSQGIKTNRRQQRILFKELHQKDRARILAIFTAYGISEFSPKELLKRPSLRGRVQTEIRIMRNALGKRASLESRCKNQLPRVPQALMPQALGSFLPAKEMTALQVACVGHSSLAASRFQRLDAFSKAIKNNIDEMPILFLELHKDDRARILAKFQVETFEQLVMNNTTKKSLFKTIEVLKAERSFTHPSTKSRMDHMQKLPFALIGQLGGFLLPKEMTDLQRTDKIATKIPSSGPSIIKIYHLGTLIETYLHLPYKTLSQKEQVTALNQLMSMAFELSAIEQLPRPSYQSLASFFELIEARNLLRMMNIIHERHPALGSERLIIEIPESREKTIEKAQALRTWIEQDQDVLPALERIHLHFCGLSLLPKEISKLKVLKELSLGSNQIVSLPKEIGQLKALETMSVVNNDLMTLPKEIGQLKALKTFDISFNRLTSLPKEIGRMKALITFIASNNELTRLPKEIGRLKALQHLFLGDNRLRILPKEVGQLKALLQFVITINKLFNIPKEMAQLTGLVALDFSENGIVDLSPALEQYGNQLQLQNKILQLRNIVRQLLACFDHKHDIKKLRLLLETLEKLYGKETRSRLHKCLFEAAQEKAKADKTLQKKLKDPHFGRNGFLDKSIKPLLKVAAIAKFWKVIKSEFIQ